MGKKPLIAICLVAILFLVFVIVYVFTNRSIMPSIYVDPKTANGMVGQNVTISVSVSDVSDLFAWKFKLSWNITILELVSVTEGAFLKHEGNTFFNHKINSTLGYVEVECTLLGNVSGVNGDGILATIQFHIIQTGSCNLNLYSTMLVNSSEESIEHTIGDGYFST